MTEIRSLRVNASFEVLSAPLHPMWPVRVTLRFGEEFVQRSTPLSARVGGQHLEGAGKTPGAPEIVGYLQREPRQGEELVLRDGSRELPTGIRYRAPSAAVASVDALGEEDLYAPPEGVEARSQAFERGSDDDTYDAYALDTTCTIHGATITCGTCSATERRVRGAPGHLVDVPAAHVYGHAAHHQLTDAASAALVRMREAAIAAGTISATDDYLKLVSGHRDYATQTGIWKERLRQVFASFGCTNWTALAAVVDTTNAALAANAPPFPTNAWRDRFRSDLSAAGVSPLGCDPARMRTAAAAEHQTVSATGAIDVVDLAVRIGRQTVAPPGASPHHTGRAADLFLGHAANAGPVSSSSANVTWQRARPWFQWLVCNASRFGFFPYNREPWHWEHNQPDA